jgi:hypothetical protein
MAKLLHISKGLSLTLDAATQTFAFLGRKGSGKTYAAGKLVELLLDAGVQVLVLDNVGNWGAGLRLAADGKSQGFDIPVFGGLRGDIPLEEGAGGLIADALADTKRSAVLDLSQFSLAARRRFSTAFGERLWLRKKGEHNPSPLFLVIEESQLVVPQNVRGGDERMVGIFEEIVRLGRNYGIGVAMISQRPQSVNKEVLNQTECLFVFQTNGRQERDALKKWVVAQGADVDLVEELPGLPVGTAFVWSPQWLRIFKRVEISPKNTFDASATPKVGDKRQSRELAPLDLDDLREKMKDVVERAAAEDPRALRRRVAELEGELKVVKFQKSMGPPPAPAKVVERPVIKDGQVEKLSGLLDKSRQVSSELEKALAAARDVVRAPAPRPAPVRFAPELPRFTTPPGTSVKTNGHATLAGGERKILTALAQYPAGRSQTQVAILTAYAQGGGGFRNYIGALRSRCLIEGDKTLLYITHAGLAELGDFEPRPRGDELLQHWYRQLGKAERGILEALAASYPSPRTAEQVATQTGYEPGGGGFRNAIGRLRSLELVVGKSDNLRASESLFD